MNIFDDDIPAVESAVNYLVRAGLPEILSTSEAATLLRRKPQTLHVWACRGTGPIQPHRIMGRLAWRTSEVLALLKGDAQ